MLFGTGELRMPKKARPVMYYKLLDTLADLTLSSLSNSLVVSRKQRETNMAQYMTCLAPFPLYYLRRLHQFCII